MPTALVVGASGFVGSYVTKCLLQKGYEVRGTCRDPTKATWLQALAEGTTGTLTLHALTLTPQPVDEAVMDGLIAGCAGAFMCAGYETQDPTTIDFMVNAGLGVLAAAKRNAVGAVVLTSSTGSTNPPGVAADAIKDELTFWSDPEQQKGAGKFSPAAKTLMEQKALAFVGRDLKGEIVDQDAAKGAPRLCILNPSLILGPQLQPGGITGMGLPWFVKISKGQAMAAGIPNDSMSIIHAEDLAKLHVACLEHPAASGRYFGVERSWPWEEILPAIKAVYPPYVVPPRFEGESKPPTQFDNTRRDSLGVQLRGLDAIMKDTIHWLQERGELQA